jgi:hypothetical protein
MCACLYYLIRLKEEFFLCESGFLPNLEESNSLPFTSVCITVGHCVSNCVTVTARITKRASKGNRKSTFPAFPQKIVDIFIFSGLGISFVHLI